MATFTAWTLDVWGNDEDGFDVNDRCKVGTIEIPEDASDADILGALVESSYLKPGSDAVGEVDDSSAPFALYIGDKRNGEPWLQLESMDEDNG